MNLSTPQRSFSLPRKENCGDQSCGECLACRHRARVAIADYVVRKVYTERKRSFGNARAEDRRYAAAMLLKMLDAAGLSTDRQISLDDIQRSDWGRAMRGRQLSDGRTDGSDSP